MRQFIYFVVASALLLGSPVEAQIATTTVQGQITGTWAPTANGLTVVGSAPTITGIFVKTGYSVTLHIKILCGGSCTTTASTAGTTYFTGAPYSPADVADACPGAVDNTTGINFGGSYFNGNFFAPTWSATVHTILLTCTFQSST